VGAGGVGLDPGVSGPRASASVPVSPPVGPGSPAAAGSVGQVSPGAVGSGAVGPGSPGAVGSGVVGSGAGGSGVVGSGAGGSGAGAVVSATRQSAAVVRGRASVPAPVARDVDVPAVIDYLDERPPGRWLRVGFAGAMVVVAVVAILIAGSRLGGPGTGEGSRNGGAAPAATTKAPAVARKPTAAPTGGAGQANRAGAGAIVTTLYAVVDRAVDRGAIDPKAAEDIGDKLDDLREAVDEGRGIAEAAEDLREELQRHRADGTVDTFVRAEIAGLLITLLQRAAGDDQDD
jgi:hypothetical protein